LHKDAFQLISKNGKNVPPEILRKKERKMPPLYHNDLTDNEIDKFNSIGKIGWQFII